MHVDINSYFATILQQENPHLRGRPIGVVKSEGRTCIIAASKEAKQQGVGTGSRIGDALLRCPDLIRIPAEFDRYLDVTKRLQKIFQSIAPSVYIYSLDEAFIDVTECRKHLYPDINKLGKTIQQKIFLELGEWVTCNIGIAENRLMAKMASEIAPKGSILQVTPENKDVILAKTNFNDVCGVGYRLGKKLSLFNVFTPYQIRFFSLAELESMVGPFWAKELQKIAYGKETHLLSQLDRELPHMKSVGRSITGYKLCSNETEIKQILKNLCLEIIHKVRKMELAGRQVWLGLYGHEQYWSSFETFKTPISHAVDLIEWVEVLFQRWNHKFPVIKFAVRLSLLQPEVQKQLLPKWQKNEAVQIALDAVNQKYGMYTLHPAAVPKKEDLIYPEVTGFLGDRLYQLR